MQHDQQRRFILAGLQFLQETRGERRLPRADVADDQREPFHVLRRILEPRERFGVLLGLKKEAIVNRDGKRIFFELEEFEQTHGESITRLEIGNATLLPLGQGDAGGSHRGGFSGRRVVFSLM